MKVKKNAEGVAKTSAKPKTAKRSTRKPATPKRLNIVKNDSWLEPFEAAIQGRHDHVLYKINELTRGKGSLSDFADGHLYFGLHKTEKQWILREWAPNATAIYLIGEFNDRKESDKFAFKRIEGTGNSELKLPLRALHHENLYKLSVHWDGGQGERVPKMVTARSSRRGN